MLSEKMNKEKEPFKLKLKGSLILEVKSLDMNLKIRDHELIGDQRQSGGIFLYLRGLSPQKLAQA